MSSVQPPPIGNPVVDNEGKSTLPWVLFFDQTFRGDTGRDWTPVPTNLTQVGTPTITGRVYQLSRALAVFVINIIPGTSTSSTAGSTYFSGFPLTMSGDGACFAVSGLLGSPEAGMADRASNRIYPPAWSAVTVSLTIFGIVEAS